ncbi:MAG: methyltransferase [Ferruginibacter sp.]|nr:methyltransferase [Ferruginibacter sp.]
MNTTLKNIIGRTYKPWLEKYLAKTRQYKYKGIKIEIPPEVFHPGFFFSTKLLLQFVERMDLHEKKLLELGCGSGLISIMAAQKDAVVTATDINSIAVEFLKKNSSYNKVSLKIIRSDLFQEIPPQLFDIIVINPPYYKKQPVTEKDHAWFCGENGEYFSRMFGTISNFIHTDTMILMVLSDGCDKEMIDGIAVLNGFMLNCVHSRQNMLEKNFIFKIEQQV